MNKASKIIVGLAAVVVVVIGAAAIAISVVDINAYRPQLADMLGKQTGRTVGLNGPIKLALSMHGVSVIVQDASISNPAWASRKQMAGIGRLELGVALIPLLSKQLVITALDISNADIQLETSAAGQNNWDMKPEVAAAPAAPQAKPQAAAGGSPVGIKVEGLSVKDSQLAMRDKEGKTSLYKVSSATLKPKGHGTAIDFGGEANGAPVKLSLTIGTQDLMANAKFPFEADVTYDKYHLTAKGSANPQKKFFDADSYQLTAGTTTLHGALTADAGGARTSVKGNLQSDKLDPNDLKPNAQEEQPAAKTTENAKPAPAPSGRLFSTAPLDLAALRSTDASFDVAIGQVVLGKTALNQLSSKLSLSGGHLTVPFKAALGKSPFEGELKLDAASTAQYSLNFKAPDADLAELLSIVGAPPVLNGGKGNADVQLAGSGASPHDLAASTNGHINVIATGGTISASAAGAGAAALSQILAPGGGNPVMDCLAARFNVANGVAKDNGILADSSASTVAGSGGFNLGAETIDMTLRASPKLVKTGGLLPPLHIGGSLSSPSFGVDAAGTIQSVASGLLGGKTGLLANAVGGDSGVPDVKPAPDGSNACVYALDHKTATAAAPSQNTSIKDVAGQAGTKAQELGNKVMQGLFGH